MTELRQRMIHDMQIRNYSPRTIEVYTYHVGCFAKFCGQSPLELGPEDVRQYQVHLVETKKVSWPSFNQAVCALRFLYRTTIPRGWPVTMIPFAKKPKKLPTVLGRDEVERLLAHAYPLKHRTVLTVLVAAGLRLEEALHLKCTDLDSPRMLLRVACGKGAKERLVPYSPRLLQYLRDYWRNYRPQSWLFPGLQPDRRLDPSVVQKCCRRAASDAGFSKRVTPHTLRHSFATGLMEAGVDLLTLGRLLGHRSFSSTLIYLHVRRPHLESMPSPLDWLPVDQCPRFAEPTMPTPPATDPVTASPPQPPADAAPLPVDPHPDRTRRPRSTTHQPGPRRRSKPKGK